CSLVARIFYYDAQMRVRFFRNQFIGFFRILYREPMRRECCRSEPERAARTHQTNALSQIVCLGPAYPADRVLDVVFFEVVVVSSGPIGTRDDDRKLFLHKLTIRKRGAGDADQRSEEHTS